MGRSCTSIGAITCFSELFGSYGSPDILYTDNGPQFDSYAFKEFAKRWSFVHTTSSPRYAQSNGFGERMVQTVKNTLRKAKMDDIDPDLALLSIRTTPISNNIRSPMELLMNRKGKANLPVSMRNQLPDAEQIGAAFVVTKIYKGVTTTCEQAPICCNCTLDNTSDSSNNPAANGPLRGSSEKLPNRGRMCWKRLKVVY